MAILKQGSQTLSGSGVDGVDGESAYQAWLNEGNSGTTTDFLNSLIGADGAQGIQGVTGADGVIPNPLDSIKIASFGDSITVETGQAASPFSYMDDFRDVHGMDLRNYAVGAADLVDNSTTSVVTDNTQSGGSVDNVVSNQIEYFLTQSFVPDIIILTGGANDTAKNIPADDINIAISNYETPASQNKLSVHGLLFWACRKFREVNPLVKIILITPPKGNVSQTVTFPLASTHNSNLLSKIVTPMRLAAKYLGVDLIEWYDRFHMLDSDVPNDVTIDTLHFTTDSKNTQHKEVLSVVKKYYN